MQRDARARLYDAIRACQHIIEFTGGKAVEEIADDVLLSSAVERQFEILGESLNAFNRLQPTQGAQLEELSVAVAMRNLIAHQYFVVDTKTVVQTAHNDIPGLKVKLEAILSDQD